MASAALPIPTRAAAQPIDAQGIASYVANKIAATICGEEAGCVLPQTTIDGLQKQMLESHKFTPEEKCLLRSFFGSSKLRRLLEMFPRGHQDSSSV